MPTSATAKVPPPQTQDASYITSFGIKITTLFFVLAPLATVAAIAIWGLTPRWWDVALGLLLYFVAITGVSLGYHRMLTHKSFVAAPWLKALLTIMGSTSLEGAPIGWVALHRRHHQLSDTEGDPHSPHTHGSGAWGVTKGFLHAHVGWLFKGENPQAEKYAPDLLKDPLIRKLESSWWVWAVLSVFLIPAVVGLIIDGWFGALLCVLWAGIIRMGLVHHITWSVNSVCHIWGKRPFESRDESRNVAWLAIPSMGESFHNGHHAFPSSARHGLEAHQWDASARLISWFERFGWVNNVKWMTREYIDKKRINKV